MTNLVFLFWQDNHKDIFIMSQTPFTDLTTVHGKKLMLLNHDWFVDSKGVEKHKQGLD